MGKLGGAVIDLDRLEKVCVRLGEVVVDPVIWPQVMSDVCAAVGATTAALLTPEEMCRNPLYSEALLPFGFEWFAVIAFQAGPALWGLSIQRTPTEGPFDRQEKAILSSLSDKLTGVASLSHAVGRAALSSATNALNSVRSPAIAIDRSGYVLDANPAAQALLDSYIRIRGGRLVFADVQANAYLDKLIKSLQGTSEARAAQHDPIIIRRPDQRPIVLRALPVHAAAQTPFLAARALLLFTPIEAKPGPHPRLLSKVFGLTPAEARLASIMAEGANPEEAAEELHISRETARNQLRAIFAKTTTHRQSELVALLSRL